MKHRHFNPFRSAMLVAASFALSLTFANADPVNQTWLDAGPNNFWSTLTGDENWDAGVVWTQNNHAVFTGAGETVTLGEAISAGNLTFAAATGIYTITGNTLTLAAGSVIDTGANNATIGSILAGGGITKTGGGTLTLCGNNTFTGGVTINAGTLTLNNVGALNSTTPNAIALGLSGSTNPTLALGTGSFTLGAVTVAANVTGATISMPQNSSTYSHTIAGATLDSPLNFTQANATSPRWSQITWTSKITGTGGGSGNDTLVFNNTSSMQNYMTTNAGVVHDFSGNVHVKAGVIAAQSGNAGGNLVIPDSSMLWIEGGEWRWNSGSSTETIDGLRGAGKMGNPQNVLLTINADNASNDGNRSYSGNMGNLRGVLTMGGAGTQEFTGSVVTFNNGVNLNNGTLKLTKTTAWGSAIAFGASNTPVLQLNAPDITDAWTFSKPITGTNVNASVTKTGAGAVYITSAQTYAGTTTVNEGKLLLVSATEAAPTSPAIWLDASAASTVHTNGSGQIYAWDNQGVEGGSYTNGTIDGSTTQPTYLASDAAFNNKPVVNFTKASSQVLTNITTAISNSGTALHAFVVFNRTSANAYGGLFSFRNKAAANDYNNPGSFRLGDNNGSATTMSIDRSSGYNFTMANATTYVFDFSFDGSNLNPWLNSSALPSAARSGNFAYSYSAIGGRWEAGSAGAPALSGNYWDGKVAEILVYNNALTTAQRQGVETYLGRKWVSSNYGNASLAGPVTVAASATFGGYGSAGPVVVANGGILQGGLDSGTGTLTVGNLTLNGTAILKGGISATPGTKAISVADFTVNGGAQSVLLAGLAGTGLTDGAAYDFLTWSGTSNVTDTSVFKKTVRNLTPTLDLANKKVQLTYSAATSSIYWTGGSSAWDGSASNWKETVGDGVTQFLTNDVVFFHDTTGSALVDISATDVNPASTTFDATTTAYTLQGTKGIASGTITKNNGGSLTINNTNPTSGAVALNGGTVSVSQTGSLGSGDLTLDGGVTLQYTGPTATSTRSVTINNAVGAGGATMEVANAGTTFQGGGLNGAGALVKTGAGALGFGGAGTYTGAITLSGGTLVANHATALGTGSVTVAMGDAATGANPVEFKVDSAITSKVTLASLSNSNFGSSQTITLNSGGALPDNAAALVTTLNLSGSVPVTLKATNTSGHNTAQDMNWRIEGSGIPAGTTALILDGTAKDLRTSQLGDATAGSNFTGDVLIKGFVSTQGRTYLAGGGTVAENQNLNFANNDVTVDTGAQWRLVWGGETMGALNGSGLVTLFNQNALDNIGLTLGNNDRPGTFSGTITGGFGLRKKGTATQILSGTGNSYSGPTLIESGTLQVDGTKTGGGSVTVKPYATLSGSGSVGGTTTVEGFGTVSPAGDAIGTLTLSNATLQGTYQCNLDDTTADLLAVSGTLTVATGATITIVGAPVADSYTIATFGTLNGGLPLIAAPAGYSVAVDTAVNEIVLRKSTAYDLWAGGFAGLTDVSPESDPDADGISNMMEFVIGGDPRVSSMEFLPKESITGTDLVLSYKRNDASETETVQTGQWSVNLSDWTDIAPVLVNENDAAADDMEIRIPLSNAVNGVLFGRLSVTMP